MKELLVQVPKFYKVNLHCHTNISDGSHTPEEVKEFYKSRGYHAVAFTDHEVCVPHPELTDEDFIALTSYELSTKEEPDASVPGCFRKTYHLNFISKDPANRWQVCDLRRLWGNGKALQDELVTDGFEEWEYSLEAINEIIARHNEKGYLTIFNHPVWSMQDYRDYAGLKGVWGTEVYNNEAYTYGYGDHQDIVFEQMLRAGQNVFPVAADDFHHMKGEQFIAGGWLMVGAKEFSYGAIMEALEKGDFYATMGPEISSITYDGECYITVKTKEPVRSINMTASFRYMKQVTAEEGVTEGQFGLGWIRPNAEEHGIADTAWVRFVITDMEGRKAYTPAYYLRDI